MRYFYVKRYSIIRQAQQDYAHTLQKVREAWLSHSPQELLGVRLPTIENEERELEVEAHKQVCKKDKAAQAPEGQDGENGKMEVKQ